MRGEWGLEDDGGQRGARGWDGRVEQTMEGAWRALAGVGREERGERRTTRLRSNTSRFSEVFFFSSLLW